MFFIFIVFKYFKIVRYNLLNILCLKLKFNNNKLMELVFN